MPKDRGDSSSSEITPLRVRASYRDPISIILSIRPTYAHAILNGIKKYEYRRKVFQHRSIKTAYMYASSPVCKIVGEFSIKTIVQTDPSSLWVKTKKWAGVDKVFFDEYFRGYEVAYALQIGEVTIYEQPPSLSSKFGI